MMRYANTIKQGRSSRFGTAKGAVFLLLGMLLAPTVQGYDLDQHLWQERVLILVAPTAEDAGLVQQRRAIAARRDALLDRDLRVVELVGKIGTRDGVPLAAAEVDSLRSQFAMKQDARLMILVGLDGGTKRREALDSELAEVFRQIDGMPMRRADIRAKKAAGIPVTEP